MSKLKKVKFIIQPPSKHWVGDGFHVHSMFHPQMGDIYPHTSPFIMMDFAPPKEFSKTTKKRGVGEHPHKGFETVTFAFEGEVEHRDSAGGGGIIKKGDVQWMTAASGLVHEEFHSRDFAEQGGLFEMVQLWVNLPKKDKNAPPRYQGIKNEQFPKVNPIDGVHLELIAGTFADLLGPCKTFTPITMFTLKMDKGSEFNFELEQNRNLLILQRKGHIFVNNNDLKKEHLAIFEREGEQVEVTAMDDSELLILSGEPIDEPIFAYGPFVMNSKEEIIQAIEEFNKGKMGRLG